MGLFDDVALGEEIELENTEDLSDDDVFMEAGFPDTLPYLKCINRIVYLPKGQKTGFGNLCFLYTHDVAESIALMTTKENYLSRNRYSWYFYPPRYRGKLRGKPYKINQLTERPSIYQTVEKTTRVVRGYKKLDISGMNGKNTFYDISKYIEIFDSICTGVSINRMIGIYWNYMKQVYNVERPSSLTNKFVLCDVKRFPLGKNVRDNLSNPLFMIYYTLFKKPELINLDLNMDFYFFAGKKTLRINPYLVKDPAKECRVIRNEMNKLYRSFVPDVDNILDVEKIDKEAAADEAVHSIISRTNNEKKSVQEVPIVNDRVQPKEVKKTVEANEPKYTPEIVRELKKVVDEGYEKKKYFTGDTFTQPVEKPSPTRQEIKKEIEAKAEKAKEAIVDNDMDSKDAVKAVETELEREINDDKALLEKIYRENQRNKIKQTPASTARDKLLREEQVKRKVGDLTVGDLEKLAIDDIPIYEDDVTEQLQTSNKKMGVIKFDNINKIYDDKVMLSDLIKAVTFLADKSIPIYLRGDVDIKDTSDHLNYKDTYTFYLEDALRQRHTIKVDIPKFVEHKFLYLGGNEKVVKNQLFLYPVVKTEPDEIQIVTNYNKMTIKRIDSKSVSGIERFKKLLAKSDAVKDMCKIGNVKGTNIDYVTTLEYDELSKIMSVFKSGKCQLFFSQEEATKYANSHDIKLSSNRLFVGIDNSGDPIFVNLVTQRTVDGRSILDIIIENLPAPIQTEYMKVKSPKRLAHAQVTVMKQNITVAFLLCLWEGLTTVLKKAKVNYRLEKRVPSQMQPTENAIKFADCALVYEETVPAALLMNGLKVMDLSGYNIADMDDMSPYLDYFKKRYGRANVISALDNFYEFTIDPITKEILETTNLPTDLVELVLYTINLLADSQFIPNIRQSTTRNRCHEIIPAIFFECVAKAYLEYKNSNGKKKLSIPQDEVIKKVLKVPTNEDNSTLNPILEMEQQHATSTKGFRGINLDDSYNIRRRTFDPTSIGVLGPSSSPDANVGIQKTLSLEPRITSIRGFIDIAYDPKNPDKSLEGLSDVNLFSIGELSIPLGATIDDPTRLGHAIKQSKHVIPVVDSAPVLMSNGLEEVARFHLSSHFVVNADEDGEVVEYDEAEKLMVVRYKSGKCRAIDLNGSIVKNGGGGFYLSNVLVTPFKLGDKFKKNDALAYHKDFFTNDKYNNCRMNMGTLAKVAIMSTYNTYEDATFVTQSLSQRAATEMCFCKKIVIGKNSNVEFLVKKGDHIEVGDPLAVFDTSYEDPEVNAFLSVLDDEQKAGVLENSRNTVPSKYSGVIEDIKIFSDVDISEMSPSLKKVVARCYNAVSKKIRTLEKYDPESKDSIVKCGILMDQISGRVDSNRFGIIRGEYVEDAVLVEIYIKHAEPLEVGSKIANFTGLKNTVGEVITAGYEPWSEFRPEEEVSTIIASNSILKRMTPSILLTALGNKVVIELKNKLREIYES